MSAKAQVPCPTCGKLATFFEEPIGPFCSMRCQMVDLGKWLGEEYRISEPLRPDHFSDENEDDPPQRSGVREE